MTWVKTETSKKAHNHAIQRPLERWCPSLLWSVPTIQIKWTIPGLHKASRGQRGGLFGAASLSVNLSKTTKFSSFFSKELPDSRPRGGEAPIPPRAGKQGPIPSPHKENTDALGQANGAFSRMSPARACRERLASNYPPDYPRENLSVTHGWERSDSNLLSKSPPSFPVASFGHSILSSFLPLNLSRLETRNSHVGVR